MKLKKFPVLAMLVIMCSALFVGCSGGAGDPDAPVDNAPSADASAAAATGKTK